MEAWALEVNVSQRQFQRTCELYVLFAPRMLLPLYHALYYMIMMPSITECFDSPTAEDIRIKSNNDYYVDYIESVVKKIDTVYKDLIR